MTPEQEKVEFLNEFKESVAYELPIRLTEALKKATDVQIGIKEMGGAFVLPVSLTSVDIENVFDEQIQAVLETMADEAKDFPGATFEREEVLNVIKWTENSLNAMDDPAPTWSKVIGAMKPNTVQSIIDKAVDNAFPEKSEEDEFFSTP